MNSGKFPKFTFSGKIDKVNKVKFTKNGVYKVTVTGNLTIKGITKPVSSRGTITVKDGTVSTLSSFSIKLADYAITGQPIEAGKISTEPKITVSATF